MRDPATKHSGTNGVNFRTAVCVGGESRPGDCPPDSQVTVTLSLQADSIESGGEES